MLRRIEIRNLAVIDHIDLTLGTGFCVLTGETGAGKSILIDALGLALGDRAEGSAVRHGAERAEITAEFDIGGQAGPNAWLKERDMDEGGACVVRRVISADRGSRAYINGRPATAQDLREIGEQLVEIHGQHEHQSLLRRDEQRGLLDQFANHSGLQTQLADIYRRWRKQQDELQRLDQLAGAKDNRLELLRYQVEELASLNLQPGEPEALNSEFRRQSHVERLLQECQRILELTYEGDEVSAYALIGEASKLLHPLLDLDNQLTPIQDLLENAAIQLREATDHLRRHLDSLEIDPERLRWLEQRLDATHELSRKHRVPLDQLPDQLARLQTELIELNQASERRLAATADLAVLEQQYRQAATQLSTARTAAARPLGNQITEVAKTLGMPHALIQIQTRFDPEQAFAPHGQDQVEFLIATNPGQPLQPLTKVASGGELSRVSLAIRVIAAGQNDAQSMVFDEVDTGVGGAIAEMIGRRLARLAQNRQVLCVTHLPQVAAYAHCHFQVRKDTDGQSTRTVIAPLSETHQVEELARMLGGMEITARTREHAQEMIHRARQQQLAD